MRLQAGAITGHGNLVVQITGDANRVTLGATQLVLHRRHRFASAPRRLLELLVTKLQAVPFVGSEAELAALQGWLDGPDPVGVRCVTGGAGSGKTRLALKLCALAEDAGWDAGFAEQDALLALDRNLAGARVHFEKRVLMVVDYALSAAPVLRKVLVKLLDRETGADRLRVLLLERQADARDGWLAELARARSHSEYGLDELFDPAGPRPLAPLGEADAELVRAAAAAAVTLADARPGLDAADLAARVLAAAAGRTPLDLLMALAVAAGPGDGTAADAPRTELARHLARRELARIGALAAQPAGGFLEHLALILTLQGGATRDALEAVAVAEWQALERQGAFDKERIARLLVDALPAGDGSAAPILPDLIGEAALLEGLAPRAPATQAAVIARAFARAPDATAQAVVRTVQDFVHRTDAPLAWVDELVERADEPLQLTALADALPHETVAMRECAAAIAERLVGLLGSTVAAGVGETRPYLAAALSDFANRLSDLGRREAALEAAERAFTIRRDLAAERPDTFRPDLAASLHTLAYCRSALRQHAAALEAAAEAVRLYCELAEERPDAFRPDLAGSLDNLASFLCDLKRYDEALAAAEDAVGLYRELAAARAGVFRSDLARSLRTLATCRGSLRRLEEALEAAAEAVRLQRELAKERPDQFRDQFAGSLDVLGRCQILADNPGGAVASFAEGIAVLRPAFERLPSVFSDLMRALVDGYERACDESGTERDSQLLAPVVAALEKLQPPEAGGPPTGEER